ncbi:MAG: PEP/pyruvate-binding domain-containing protein [Myxococcota bacterium]
MVGRDLPLAALLLATAIGCSAPATTPPPVELTEGACTVATASAAPDFLSEIPCKADFQALASAPLDSSIPGARSGKVVLDQIGGDTLYFQNSRRFPIHHDFTSTHLSGGALPLVPALAEFNQTEYFAPDRRFLLGAVTYHAGPNLWVLEIAPYDTASAEMIEKLFRAVAAHAYFGPALAFHPTSDAVALEAQKLPRDILIKTTDDIYAGIDYQPLNLATAIGRLHFMTAAELATDYVSYRDIVVLDDVPNDITVVTGIITEQFQTPLSHINVLSQNRRTPNMGLRNARTNPTLKALEGQWVEITVGALEWSVRAATASAAEAYWEAHKPPPVSLPAVDMGVTDLRNIEDVVDESSLPLREALRAAVGAFGGKAIHYSILAKTKDVPMRKAFAIPAYHYVHFMQQNGLYDRIRALQADPDFVNIPEVRDQKLAEFRALLMRSPLDEALQAALRAKLEAEYPGLDMRFRTSTNSEDLDGFPCAGCYESHSGTSGDWNDTWDAIREAWSSIWLFRTYEERTYYSVDHESVVMALLVHHNFPNEAANGVALTSNPYDTTGAQPGFYVNVQYGGLAEVVHPPPGVTTDQLVILYDEPGHPVTYLAHSNLVPSGHNVLDAAQLSQLGKALHAIHERFSPAYGPASGNTGWYAMDVEFKFDSLDGVSEPTLQIKQARSNPGRGQ